MFNSNIYSERREFLRKKVGSGIIVLFGNDESPMNYKDNPYHFRQDSTFLYYVGLKLPRLFFVLDIDTGNETLYGTDYTVEDYVIVGKQPTLSELASLSGIRNVDTEDQFYTKIRREIEKGRQLHFLPLYRAESLIKLKKVSGIDPENVSAHASVQLIKTVVEQRSIKTEIEIEEIEKAVNTSVDMHEAAMRLARPGIKELDIVAEVDKIARAAGGYPSFPTIATINGQILHNQYHGNTLKEGDLFLLDCGAETEMGYSGDLSSTFPVSKKFTERQKEIYEITLEAHNNCVDALMPGITNREIHRIASLTIARRMKEMGFMKGDMEEAVEAGAHALFFPCGVGHMMGLDIHDMEDLGEVYVGYEGKPKSTQFGLKSLRLARALEPGFVLTIEPGIYFIPELIDQWRANKKFTDFIDYEKVEKYRNFGGIRNEEDYLITTDGKKLLGKPLAKTIKEVEALRNE